MRSGGWWLVRMLVLAVLAISGVVSCGGDGGSCAMVAACGGDPVGNWQITSSCLRETGTLTESSTCAIGVDTSGTITGMASFMADLTYSFSWAITGSETADYPASCLTLGTQTTTCDDLTQFFTGLGSSPTVTGTCVAASGGGCHCRVTFNQLPEVQSGTYVASGGTLALDSGTGGPEPDGYCVRGNRMDLTPPAMMMMMMPMTTSASTLMSSGDLVFARR